MNKEMPDYDVSLYERTEQMDGDNGDERLLAERLRGQHEMMDGNQPASNLTRLDRYEREDWPDIPVLD